MGKDRENGREKWQGKCRVCGATVNGFGEMGRHLRQHRLNDSDGGGRVSPGVGNFSELVREEKARVELMRLRQQQQIYGGNNDLMTELLRQNQQLQRELSDAKIERLRDEINDLKVYVSSGGASQLELKKMDVVISELKNVHDSIREMKQSPIAQAISKKILREGNDGPPVLKRYTKAEMQSMNENLKRSSPAELSAPLSKEKFRAMSKDSLKKKSVEKKDWEDI